MSEPTTAEMIAWCEMEEIANRAKARQGARISSSQRSIDQNNNRAAMLRAIAARLRQASGEAEPAPTFEAAPANVTVLAPKRT